jgi:hypothetical protein
MIEMQNLTKFFQPKEKIHNDHTTSQCESNDDTTLNDNLQRSITLNNNPPLKKEFKMNQPVIDFPVRLIAGQNRKFNAAWYERFSWIDYDIGSDSAYCGICRSFP